MIACVCLMDEIGCFEFWSFYIDTDMRVCIFGADSHVSSFLSGSSEKKTTYFEGIDVFYAFFCSFMFVCAYSFWRSVLGSLIVF
jgi:hypothetical protein